MKINKLLLTKIAPAALAAMTVGADALHRQVADPLHQAAALPNLSTKMKQFRLRESLMSSLPEDSGIDNQRRLAKNAIRLGIATDEHRKLFDIEVPDTIVERFKADLPLPRQGPRLPVDGIVDALPFMDGPGVDPGLPEGAEKFWLESGGAEEMWEILACPVVDVEAFMLRPDRCIFGDSTAATLFDFFTEDTSPSDLARYSVNTMLEVAKEAAFDVLDDSLNFFGPLQELLEPMCGVLDIISLLYDVISSVSDTVGGLPGLGDIIGVGNDILTGVGDGISDAVDKIGGWLGFRRRLSLDREGMSSCAGHMTACGEHIELDCAGDCFDANGVYKLGTDGCSSCLICYEPISHVDGICVSATDFPDFLVAEEGQGNEAVADLLQIHLTMLDRHLENMDSRIVEALHLALGTDGENTISVVKAIAELDDIVKDQCPRTDAAREKEQLRGMLRKSAKFHEAEAEAAKRGIGSEALEDMLDRLVDELKGLPSDTDDAVKKMAREFFDTSKLKSDFEEKLKKEVLANQDTLVVDAATSFLKKYITDGGRRHLQETSTSSTTTTEVEIPQSELGDICRNGLGVDGIVELVTDFIGDVTERFIFGASQTQSLVDAYGELADEGYGDEFAEFNAFIYQQMKAFDPFSADSVLLAPYKAVYRIQQAAVSKFLFGCLPCDPTESDCECGTLPSIENKVITVAETRGDDPKYFLKSGCDGNFEGEVLFGEYALDLIELILDAIIEMTPSLDIEAEGGPFVIFGEVGISWNLLNIPIAAMKLAFSMLKATWLRLGQTCDYLGGFVQGSQVEAIYGNSVWALKELACRDPAIGVGFLQRGYGCDGIDNTCDPDKQVDECAEDVFPPEIDAAVAIQLCADKIFASSADALNCFAAPGLVTATDDCKKVVLTSTTNDNDCSTDVKFTAVAQGCGDRVPEDTTVLVVPGIKVDGDAPVVTCGLDTQGLTGNGAGMFTDLQFHYTAVDGGDKCTATEDLAVSIEVFSNEVVETGDEMVSISTPAKMEVPSIWAEDRVCKTDESGKCKISSPKKSRQYVVHVTAVDEAGNVGTAVDIDGNVGCSTTVGNQVIDGDSDPLFLVKKLEVVGGVEPPVE